MNLIEGQQVLIRRIVENAGSTNVVLPNGPDARVPRYVIQEAGGSQRTRTVDGVTEARPEIVVQVETKRRFSTQNNNLVSALIAMFPVTAVFEGVTILEAPLPRPPLPVVDGVYTVPVIIRGFTSF